MSDVIIKALNTAEEMFEDRGYIAVYERFPELDITKRMVGKIFYTKENKKVILYIIDSTSQIKIYSDLIINIEEYEVLVFIYTNSLTIAHKELEKNLDHRIEIWSVNRLVTNFSKHYLQPKICLVEKKPDINYKLQKISFYDPLIRYYRYKHHSIIKIIELDGSIAHRIVV